MSSPTEKFRLSLKLSQDVWAVLLSIALALLVRAGIIAKVPW